MDNIGFGLWMTAMGMGTVFLLLALLMGVLLLMGRMDRPKPAPAAVEAPASSAPAVEAQPTVHVSASGLSDDQLAAIAIAVTTHAEVRRKQAAPSMRRRQPGSELHHSRWTSFGRGIQTQIHQRRRA